MMHRTLLGIVKIIQLFSDLARRDDSPPSLKMVTDRVCRGFVKSKALAEIPGVAVLWSPCRTSMCPRDVPMPLPSIVRGSVECQ